MRALLLILIVATLGLSACTYTKTDSAGRVEKITRDEYKDLQD